jgi:hypothetical protein
MKPVFLTAARTAVIDSGVSKDGQDAGGAAEQGRGRERPAWPRYSSIRAKVRI